MSKHFDEIQQVVTSLAPSLSGELAGQVIDLEGFGSVAPESDAGMSVDTVISALRTTSAFKDLTAGKTKEEAEIDLEAMAYGIIEAGDGAAKMAALQNQLGQEAIISSASAIDLEGYDPATTSDFRTAAALQSVMSISQSPFGNLFFPTHVLPAGTPGYTFSIGLDRVYRSVTRAKDGKLTEFGKSTMVEAMRDPQLIDINGTKVVPVHRTETADRFVAEADLDTWNENVEGAAVTTSALINGNESSLISLSAHNAVLKGGVFDETDALDSAIYVKEAFVRLAADDGATNTGAMTLRLPLGTVPGALLQQTQEDSDRDYHTSFKADFTLDVAQLATASAKAADDIPALIALINAASSDTAKIKVTFNVSARANTETSNALVDVSNFRIVGALDSNGAALAQGEVDALNNLLTPRELGATFDTSRSSLNLRTAPTIVDSTSRRKAALPARLGSPIVSKSPVGIDRNVGLETLRAWHTIVNRHRAVDEFFRARDLIKNSAGAIPTNSPMVAAMMGVTPTHVSATVDVDDFVGQASAAEGLNALRMGLLTGMQITANRMVTQGGIRAAYEVATGNANGYEVIAVCDPELEQFIMESGDHRTMGGNISFKVVSDIDERFKGKIMLGFRVKDGGNTPHPLNNGCHLARTPLVAKAPAGRNGQISNEIHTFPINDFWQTMPVIGEIDVLNLESYFGLTLN